MTFDRILDAETRAEQQALQQIPILKAAVAGEVRLEDYVAFLEQAYHHVKHTVPILTSAIEHLGPDQGAFRAPLRMYIEEEQGHEEWILDDIAACGADREHVRQGCPSEACQRFVAYIYDRIRQVNAVAVFGMVHVLEGTSIQIATLAASRLKVSLGLPDQAFTYLDSHGALDIEHYNFFRELMAQVQVERDRQDILQTARVAFGLYGDIFRSLAGQPELSARVPGLQAQ